MMNPFYRTDIQGLRAVAVVGVILFHLSLPLPGGFLGVDAFFVISGYLIFGILWRELENSGKLSFPSFYLRRFFRLAPALALMLATTLGLLAIFTPPNSQLLKDAGDTSIGATLFFANAIIAQISGGYFGRAPESNALLHTWSLSVEEQFYLTFPLAILLIWLLAKQGGRSPQIFKVKILIAAGIFFSFFLNYLPFIFHLDFGQFLFGFYSPLTRGWEFLAGAMTFLFFNGKSVSGKSEFTLPYLGCGLIILSFALIPEQGFIPAHSSLTTVLGTAMLLASSSRASPVTWLLSTRFMVWLGNLSYSLYLWHWPAIFLSKYLVFNTYAALGVGVALTLLFATASFYLVEARLRKPPPGHTKKLVAAVITLALPLALAIGLPASQNYTESAQNSSKLWRVANAGSTGNEEFFSYISANYYPCDLSSIRFPRTNPADGAVRCHQVHQNRPVTVAIVGDSHAEHLFPGMADFASVDNLLYLAAGKPAYSTSSLMNDALVEIRNSPTIRSVIFAGFWELGDLDLQNFSMVVRDMVSDGKEVYITNDLPSFDFSPDQCKYQISFLGDDPRRCQQHKSPDSEAGQVAIASVVHLADNTSGVKLIRSYEKFCDLQVCQMNNSEGLLLYRDKHHLNLNGSKWLASAIVDASRGILR